MLCSDCCLIWAPSRAGSKSTKVRHNSARLWVASSSATKYVRTLSLRTGMVGLGINCLCSCKSTTAFNLIPQVRAEIHNPDFCDKVICCIGLDSLLRLRLQARFTGGVRDVMSAAGQTGRDDCLSWSWSSASRT